MYFQTLDDKSECVGVYANGVLNFKEIPDGLTKTWKYTGSIEDPAVEFGWLYSGGLSLTEACPDDLVETLERVEKKLTAYSKAFSIGKINLREHCFYDLVPESFLMELCEIKNKITKHVFETCEKPETYKMLEEFHKLIQKIKHQNLNLNNEGCRDLMFNSVSRQNVQRLIAGAAHIDYNLFGTVTGRLTTYSNSFPVLTLRKEYRKVLKPNNDLFVSLDYNGAEVRTFLELSGHEQPDKDIHSWNMKNLFEPGISRHDAKSQFFAWLYDPESDAIKTDYYNRQKVLDKWYSGGYISTPYKRKIQVEERKALSYLIQSTTSDRVLSRAVEISKYLEGKKSFLSHIVHDEIVIDLDNSETSLVSDIKEIFEQDHCKSNIKVGKDYLDLESCDKK